MDTTALLAQLTSGGGIGAERQFVNTDLTNILARPRKVGTVAPGSGGQLQPFPVDGATQIAMDTSPSVGGTPTFNPSNAGGATATGGKAGMFGDNPIDMGKWGGSIGRAISLLAPTAIGLPVGLGMGAVNAHNSGLTNAAMQSLGEKGLTTAQLLGALFGLNEYGKADTAKSWQTAVTDSKEASNMLAQMEARQSEGAANFDIGGATLSLPGGDPTTGGYAGAMYGGIAVSPGVAEALVAGDIAGAIAAISQEAPAPGQVAAAAPAAVPAHYGSGQVGVNTDADGNFLSWDEPGFGGPGY